LSFDLAPQDHAADFQILVDGERRKQRPWLAHPPHSGARDLVGAPTGDILVIDQSPA
jgi:hypothetical protein